MSRSMAAASLVRIEMRRSAALLAFPLLLAAAWFIGRDLLSVGFLVWLDTSSAIRSSVLLLGPLVAGLSAWTATRNKRRGMGEMLCTTARPRFSRELTTWAGTALWGVAAYALYAVVLLALTLPNATWGAPLPGYLLVGLFALVAASAVGYAAGSYLPSRFVPPLVAVGTFGAQVLSVNLTRFEMLSPVPDSLVYAGVFQKLPEVALPQSVFFLGFTGVALSAVALKSGARGPAPWTAMLCSATAVAFGTVVLMGPPPPASAPADYPNFFYYDPNIPEPAPFEPVCESGDITVCVHPAYESLLPEVAGTVNEVAEPLVGIPGAPTRAVQVGNVTWSFGAPGPENATTFQLWSLLGGDWASPLAEDVALGLVQDEAAMYEEPPPDAGPDTEAPLEETSTGEETTVEGSAATEQYPPSEAQPEVPTCEGVYGGERAHYDPVYEAQSIVGSWLLRRIGREPFGMVSLQCKSSEKPAERFAALSKEEREAWLRKNLADLRAGKLTPEDLP